MTTVLNLLPSYFKVKNRFISITPEIDEIFKLLNLVTISSSTFDNFKFKLNTTTINESFETTTRTQILFNKLLELIKDLDFTIYYSKKMSIIGTQITGMIILDSKKLMYVSSDQKLDLFISTKNRQIYLFLDDFDRCQNPIIEYLELLESIDKDIYNFTICSDNKNIIIGFDYNCLEDIKSGFYSINESYCLEYDLKLKIRFSSLRPKDTVSKYFVEGIKKLRIKQQIESGTLKIVI